MSAKGFRSVAWVAGVAATALGCYMVNLKVASERVALEQVETRIVLAQRDIRVLQTEIGTRGRLAQLEQWNVKVLALSAPKANQFLEGSFQLATLTAPDKVMDPTAPVVLASAPAPARAPVVDTDGPVAAPPTADAQPRSTSPADLMHVASLKQEVREAAPREKAVEKPAVRRPKSAAPAAQPATTTLESDGKAARPGTAVTAKPVAAASAKPKAAIAAAAKPKLASTATTKPKPPTTTTSKPKETGTKR
jgi:hypothetical protein